MRSCENLQFLCFIGEGKCIHLMIISALQLIYLIKRRQILWKSSRDSWQVIDNFLSKAVCCYALKCDRKEIVSALESVSSMSSLFLSGRAK